MAASVVLAALRRQRRPSQSCGRGRTAAVGSSHRSEPAPTRRAALMGMVHRRRPGDLFRGRRDAQRSNSARAVLRGPVRRRFQRAVRGGARFRSPPGGDVFLLHAQRRRLRMPLVRRPTDPCAATRRTVTLHGTAFAYRKQGGDTLLLTNDHVAAWPVVTDDQHVVDGVSRRVQARLRDADPRRRRARQLRQGRHLR